MKPEITTYGHSTQKGKNTKKHANPKRESSWSIAMPYLLSTTSCSTAIVHPNQTMSISTKPVCTHVMITAARATGASTAYVPNANAAARLRAELLTRKMDKVMADTRARMLAAVVPAYTRQMVAMAEQIAARLLATTNAWKEYLKASSGVPAGGLLSPVLYPPGNWKAAAKDTVKMSTDTTPMVVVFSLIFSSSSFSSSFSPVLSNRRPTTS